MEEHEQEQKSTSMTDDGLSSVANADAATSGTVMPTSNIPLHKSFTAHPYEHGLQASDVSEHDQTQLSVGTVAYPLRPPMTQDPSSDPSTSSASSTNTISLAGPSTSSSLAMQALHPYPRDAHYDQGGSSSSSSSNYHNNTNTNYNTNNHINKNNAHLLFDSTPLQSRSRSHQSAASLPLPSGLRHVSHPPPLTTTANATATNAHLYTGGTSSSAHLQPLRISTRPSNKRASSYSPGLVLSPSQYSAPPTQLSFTSSNSTQNRAIRNSLDSPSNNHHLEAPMMPQASSVSLPLTNDEALYRQADSRAQAHHTPASNNLARAPAEYINAPLNQRLRALDLERPSSSAGRPSTSTSTSTNTSAGGSWTGSSSASESPFLPNANTARAYDYTGRSAQRSQAHAAAVNPSINYLAGTTGNSSSSAAAAGPAASAARDGYEAEREHDPDTSPSNPSQPSSYISQLEAEIHSSLNSNDSTSSAARISSSRVPSSAESSFAHSHYHRHPHGNSEEYHYRTSEASASSIPTRPTSSRTQAQILKGKGKERSRQTSASSGDHPHVRDFALKDQADVDLETTDLASDAGNIPWDVRETDRLRSAKDEAGRRMINQYIRMEELGRGVHGRVWLCEDNDTKEFFAVKSVNREDRRNKSLKRSQAEAQARARQEAAEQREAEKRRKQNPNASFDEEMQLNDEEHEKAVAAEVSALARKQSKIDERTMMMDEKVKQEIAIMKRIHHPNVVQLREVIDDIRSKKIFMVLEYMPGGQIEWSRDDEPTMKVEQTRRVFRDVVLGLEYLHFNGIIHRDIKPANLLWTKDKHSAKISDFGVSHVSEALARSSAADPSGGRVGMTDDRALRKTEGSPAFFAPELCSAFESTPVATPIHELGRTSSRPDYFRRISTMTGSDRPGSGSSGKMSPISPILPSERPSPKQRFSTSSLTTISRPLSVQQQQAHKVRQPERPIVGKGIDVWALGVTLYCLLFGRTPFHEAKSEYELYNMIPKKEIAIPPTMGSDKLLTGTGMSKEVMEQDPTFTEGRLVVDLLGRLLEKDPTKRIELWQVKQHPWVLLDMENSQSWLQEHDLGRQGVVQVTKEEVQQATAQRTKPQPPASGLKAALKRFGETFGFGGNALKRTNTLRDRRPSVSSTSASITTASAWEGRSDASRAASRQASIVKKKPSNTSTLTAPSDEMPPPLEGRELDTNLLSHAMALKRKLTTAKAAQVAHEAASHEGNVSVSSDSPPEEMPTKPHEHYRSSFLHQHFLSRSLSGDSSNEPKKQEAKPSNGRRQSVGHLLPPNTSLQRRVSSGAGSEASGIVPPSPDSRQGRLGSAGKGSSHVDKDADGAFGGSFRRIWTKMRSGSRTPAAASALSPSRPVAHKQAADAIGASTEHTAAVPPAIHSPGSTRRASAEYIIFSPTTSISRPSSQDTDVDARAVQSVSQSKESEAVPSMGQIAASAMQGSAVVEPGSDSSESLSDFDEEEDENVGTEALSPMESALAGDSSQPSSYSHQGGPVLWANAAEGWKFNPEIPADPLGRFLRQQRQHRAASDSEHSDTPSPGQERNILVQSEPPRLTTSIHASPEDSRTLDPVDNDDERRPLFKSDYIPPSSPYPEVKRKPTLSRDGSIQKDLKTKPPPPSPARLTHIGHAADEGDDDEEEEEVMIKPKSRFRRATNSSASASVPPSARPSLPASPKPSYYGKVVPP